jgi:putative endonuclease
LIGHKGRFFCCAKKHYNKDMPTKIIKELGRQGEIVAANYLKQNGYEILTMNFENALGYKRGELDIVAKDLGTKEIVFVEVKTLKNTYYSSDPESAITRQKYQRLGKIISSYINYYKLNDCEYRLDAISVIFDPEKRKASLKHLKHIYY